MLRIIVGVAILSTAFAVDMHLRRLTNPLAQCNDGSIATYFVQDPNPGPQQNVVIYMQGGGLCVDPITCEGRCLLAPQYCEARENPIQTQNGGIFSSDPAINPAFHNYYKVFIPYCSSDIFTGNRSAEEEDTDFHFRGHHIVQSIIRDLMTHINIGEANSVIITGGSAGGMGTGVHCDLTAQVLPRANVRCIPDSGTFSPHQLLPAEPDCYGIGNPDFDFAGVRDYWNGQAPLNCPVQGPDRWRNCSMISISYKYVQTPSFIATMKHDSWFEAMWCYPECNDIGRDDWHTRWDTAMTEIADDLVTNHAHVGLFMPACWGHVVILNDETYRSTPVGPEQLSFAQLLDNWMRGNGSIHGWDRCPGQPLCNNRCGGDNCL